MRLSFSLLLFLAATTLADWPQWRGPTRNGVAATGPALVESWAADGPKLLWESTPIPSADDGGLSSPVIAGGRVYISLVWHKDVPSATRQLDDLVLRQLGYQPTGGLGPELVAKMEAARISLSPQLRGKKLEEFASEWIKANLDKKQAQLFSGFVSNRFKKGRLAIPLEILDKLEAAKKRVFASEAELKAWLAEQIWPAEVMEQIIAAVPPTRRAADDVILCLDLQSGRQLWEYRTPGEPTGRNSSSTPAVAGGRIYALGSTQAYCVDAASGQPLWSTPLAGKGPGSSPLVVGDIVVINSKRLMAYEAATGKPLWTQEKAGGGNGSPIAWKSPEGRELVLCNGRSELQAVDVKTGDLVWTAPGGGESTPAVAGDLAAVQSNKADLGLIAYRLSSTRAEKLWNHPFDAVRNQSSPIIHGDRVYLMDDGVHYCFAATDGARLWQEPAPSAISSPLLAGDKLLVMQNNGNTLAMLRAGAPVRTELAKATVRAAWCPSPALSEGKLLLRTKDNLRCYDLAAKQ